MPDVTPVTIPDVPSEILELEVLQVPPAVASLKVVVPPLSHTPIEPVMAAGDGFTVTGTVVLPGHPPDVVPVTV